MSRLRRPYLIVGERPGDPAIDSDTRLWLHPRRPGSGRRLWRYSGLPIDRYLELFDRTNLVADSSVVLRSAILRYAAVRILRNELWTPSNNRRRRPLHRLGLVLLGRKVAAAFGLKELLTWDELPRRRWQGRTLISHLRTVDAIALPHPSGRSVWWNDERNRRAARELFATMDDEAVRLESASPASASPSVQSSTDDARGSEPLEARAPLRGRQGPSRVAPIARADSSEK